MRSPRFAQMRCIYSGQIEPERLEIVLFEAFFSYDERGVCIIRKGRDREELLQEDGAPRLGVRRAERDCGTSAEYNRSLLCTQLDYHF